ncbi:SEC14 cytosolic factor family protein / phosphoglyceride transfer family protein isoform 2 [Theobroma cacao]|uniref:SEC14 cytosolic factor family protein / phosphoglyceride transfer family protein isoform 2 n=1 Tax=Theobroma cacao TaxID=3641 RepID=A0A061FJ29_THECC|nr:SEC14 cytosolic factor family protein / phosphoglyceride transfer family protein isoform 2 [Theobroma cacao]
MAEETQKPEAAAAAAPADEVVVEKPEVTEKEPPPPAPEPEPEPEAPEKPAAAVVEEKEAEVEAVEVKKPKVVKKETKITQSVSFKEETNIVGELPESQKKALEELKQLIQEALNKHEFTAPPPSPTPPPKQEEKPVAEEKKEEEKKEEKEEEKPAAETSEEPKVETEGKSEASEKVETEEKSEASEKVETETPAPVEVKEEEKTPPPAEAPTETVVVTEVVEKVTAVDDDGAKTVEAIEESVVAVSAPPPAEKQEEEASASKEAETAPPSEEPKEAEVPPPPPEEVSIWGIPLLADERSDVILLKFLRARDFKVKDAFTMIKNTARWRKEFGIEGLLDEELGHELEKVVFMHGFDKEGHPVCYNVYGEFQNKELYQNAFADEEKRSKFLRWRIQFLEKSIRKLDFSPSGICTIVQVNDLKNSPGPGKKELRQATNQALNLLQDNYPEFVAKQVFINVPWWYRAFNMMISPFLTQRTKSKFVFAGPAKSAETLFRYIAPEQVPVQYGGLSREGEQEFTVADAVTEVTIKPSTKHTVEFPITEQKCNLVWELRVVGWDVNYGAEFVPSAEDGYTVIVSKTRKVTTADEAVISDSFKTGDPGKVVLTVDNQTSKKKKLLYRSKTKPYSD